MVTGIIRLVYFFQIDMFADVTFHSVGTMTWTLVEPGVYLIAATLPSLRPLVKYFFKDVKLERLYKKLLDRYARAQKTAEGSSANTQFNSKSRRVATIIAIDGARSAGFVKIGERKVKNAGVSKASQEDIELGSW